MECVLSTGKAQKPGLPGPPRPRVQVVYRPSTEEEALRRVERGEALVGTPSVSLPVDATKVLFITKSGMKVRKEVAEMVLNDALLMDAISAWGIDGPLYVDTLDAPDHLEVYHWVMEAVERLGVEIPEKLRRPAAGGGAPRA